MKPAIQVQGLKKVYQIPTPRPGLLGTLKDLISPRSRAKVALEDIDFEIQPGELVGLIGPNGAGKSTLVKILSGILVPDEGEVRVQGRVPWLDRLEHVRELGVVFGSRTQLWWDLPLFESFELVRAIYSIPAPRFQREREALVEALDLGPHLETPVRQLSLGLRMRGDLVASLLPQPRMLFLDEPTIGLDALSKRRVRSFLRETAQRGDTTILLTTHDLEELESLARRVLLLGTGRLLEDGSFEELRQKVGSSRRAVLEFLHPPDPVAFAGIENLPGIRSLRHEDRSLWIEFRPEECPVEELVRLGSKVGPIQDLTIQATPLEDVLHHLWGDGAREDLPPPSEAPR